MQANRSPIIRANQTHRVSGRDYDTATIAGLPEARAVPQLDRAITRKAAGFNPVPNELSNDIWSHASRVAYRRTRSMSTSLWWYAANGLRQRPDMADRIFHMIRSASWARPSERRPPLAPRLRINRVLRVMLHAR